MKFVYPHGATPLDPNEIDGLIPTHITTQAELNEWEQANIIEAILWLPKRRQKSINEKFLCDLHKKMFYKTWKWAGCYRSTNKNIGVDKSLIAIQTRNLLDDVNYQIQHRIFSVDEISARFHHRLVKIHLFPNGNGRHARISTDYLLQIHKQAPFTWGSINLIDESSTRNQYIKALRAADNHDYQLLLNFVRS